MEVTCTFEVSDMDRLVINFVSNNLVSDEDRLATESEVQEWARLAILGSIAQVRGRSAKRVKRWISEGVLESLTKEKGIGEGEKTQ